MSREQTNSSQPPLSILDLDEPPRLPHQSIRQYGCFVQLSERGTPGPGTYHHTRHEFDCISRGIQLRHPTCVLRNAVHRVPREYATSMRSETDDSFARYDINMAAVRPKVPCVVSGFRQPVGVRRQVKQMDGQKLKKKTPVTPSETSEQLEIKPLSQKKSKSSSKGVFGMEERQLNFSPCRFPCATIKVKGKQNKECRTLPLPYEVTTSGPIYDPSYDLVLPSCTQVHAMSYGDLTRSPCRVCMVDTSVGSSVYSPNGLLQQSSPGPVYYPKLSGVFPSIKSYTLHLKHKSRLATSL